MPEKDSKNRRRSIPPGVLVAIITTSGVVLVALINICPQLRGDPPISTPTETIPLSTLTSTITATLTVVSTSTSTPTTTNTSTPFPACPNASVQYLELLVSSGKFIQQYPDNSGTISLSRAELGTLTELSGRASLVNAEDCSCYWRGSTQNKVLDKITSSSSCSFSINISDLSEQTARVNLELIIGNNPPKLFTIFIP